MSLSRLFLPFSGHAIPGPRAKPSSPSELPSRPHALAAVALTACLERGYLTVAFALAALGAAYVSTLRDIPMLRHAVTALGAIVLARIAIDPRIMGAEVGRMPVLNWLLVGYGVPAVAFGLSGRLLRLRADDISSRLADALAVAFTMLLATFQIEDDYQRPVGHLVARSLAHHPLRGLQDRARPEALRRGEADTRRRLRP